ncbi:hypothetical protein [Lactococcus lactis]|uniref:hypothetical protein n=1 Tax=Lactococcus lactis TaxID=1358 RepID=UPI00384CDBF9
MDKKYWDIILESAKLFPSSLGYESWKFLVIDNSEMREDLKLIGWGAVNSLEGANKFVVVLVRKNIVYNSNHVKHIAENVLGLSYYKDSPQSQFLKKSQEKAFKLTDDNCLYNWSVKQTYITLENMITTTSF